MPLPVVIGVAASAIGGFLFNAARQYLPGIVGRVLTALGLGFFLNEVAVPSLLGMIQSQVGGLPGVMASYFGALGLDVCTTIILSAVAGRAAHKMVLGKLTS